MWRVANDTRATSTDPACATRVRAALERIAGSAPFHASPALVAFLGFVVEEVLAGRGANLKAYTVATLGLGRGSDFNPQSDAIVRTEARRLRRALAAYYAEAGREDPVRITLPLGSYAPRFTLGHAPSATARPARPAESVPASTYLTYLATFFLDARAVGWPPSPPPSRGGLAEPAAPYDARVTGRRLSGRPAQPVMACAS
jgi:hypothetical protein